MRVFHIIPGAFDYFDDINDLAFKMVDNLSEAGIQVDVMTIQFGGTKKSTTTHIKKIAPSREYLGDCSLDEAIKKMSDYDLVHLHYPTFGASRKILHELSTHPKLPLVITYYRSIVLQDFFSIVLKMSDWYFRPVLFKRAQAVTYFNEKDWNKSRIKSLISPEVFVENLSDTLAGSNAKDAQISHLLWLYNQLLDIL